MSDSLRHDDVLTTRTEPAELATRWPPFSERERARLRFLVYRRQTGRIRPPVPVRAEVNALCAALLATSGPPDPQPPKRPMPGGGVLAGGCLSQVPHPCVGYIAHPRRQGELKRQHRGYT